MGDVDFWVNERDFNRAGHVLKENGYTQDIVDSDIRGKRQELLNSLNISLLQYGAQLDDGILKLSDNANLLGIAETLQDTARQAGMDLQSGFQEIADVITEIIKSYTDAINKGIEGSLTNVEAADLSGKAKNLGIGQLDFTQTAEGLKLSEQSAIALYTALKKVDALQATLVFDKLKESLENTNENFKSTSSLISHMKDLTNALSTLYDDINDNERNVSDARLQQYSSELQIAKEILAIRSTQEDSSFNFMSNDIPAAQKNPLNYAKNWSQALQTMRDAFKSSSGTKNGKTGFIDYEDWYNIVTEMNNIAALGGPIQLGAIKLDGSLEAASDAIQRGCDSLTAIDTGDLKVNLGSIGINIQSGAEAMQQSVTDGIQAAANSQVEMLDGLIAMLEIIVAMEQLGNITGDDTTIDLGDIFMVGGEAAAEDNLDKITDYTDKFNEARGKLIDYLNDPNHKEAADMFKNTKLSLGGQQRSMYEMLNSSFDELWVSGPNAIPEKYRKQAAKSFQGLLNSFYQAAISGDYDLNDIAKSVKNIMQQTGVDLTDFVFEFTNEEGTVTRVLTFTGETVVDIDFTDTKTRKNFDTYFKTKFENNENEYRTYIQNLLEEYQKGKETDSLEFDREISIRSRLAVASNEFILKQDEDNFVGYYDGKKFKGADSEQLLTMMTKAALFKDRGFDFTIDYDKITDISTGIKAKATIGGTEVEVDFDSNGDIVYKYGNYENLTQTQLMGLLAKEGKYDTGGTYTFKDTDGKTYTSTVQYAADLNLSYSIVSDGVNTYLVYDGHQFENRNALEKFSAFRDKVDPNRNGKWNDQGKYQTSLTINGGELTISTTYDVKDGNIEFNIGGTKFTGTASNEGFINAIASYMEAASKEGFKDTTQDFNSHKRTIEYNYGKMTIEGTVDLESGVTHYEYKDGGVVKASSDSIEALEYVISKFTADKATSAFGGKTVTYNIDGKDIELIVDTTGKISIANPEAYDDKTREAVQAAIDAANANTTTTLDNPVEAEAKSVTLTLAAGANVSLNGEVTLSDPIENVNGTVASLLLNASNPTTKQGTITLATGETVEINQEIIGKVLNLILNSTSPTTKEGTITLADGTSVNIKQAIIGTIISLLLNASSPTTEVGTITLEDGTEVPINESIIGQIATILLTADSPNTEKGNIVLADGTSVPIEKIIGKVAEMILQWANEGYKPDPVGDLGIQTEYSAPDATITQKIIKKYTIVDEGFESTPNTSTGLKKILPGKGWHDTTPAEAEAVEKGWNGTRIKIENMDDFNNMVRMIHQLNTELNSNENKILDETTVNNLQELQSSLSQGLLDPMVSNAITSLNNLITTTLTQDQQNRSNITPEVENPEDTEVEIDGTIKLSIGEIEEIKSTIESIHPEISVTIKEPDTAPITTAVDNLNLQATVKLISDTSNLDTSSGGTVAKGNVALAAGTLMGELGPELWVSGGRYFVAGQNGAEFVNLPEDAIVFNHQQTASLLKNGRAGRGKPVTNETNAISLAKGNVNGGPAMAGASAALAALKQLRAQWASLAQLSAKDLAGKGGGGGGGGGDKAFIKDLERWYNWLQKIAQLEKEITHQETLRSKLSSDMVPNGKAYYNSLKEQTKKLGEQIQLNTSLLTSQQDYFDKRRAELNNKSPFSKLYTFDTNGQLIYQNKAFEQLSKMSGTDQYGKPNKTPKEQYEYIINTLGIDKKWLQYDSSGNKIKDDDYAAMVQAFWDKVDSDKDEMQNLHDSIEEQKNTILQKMDERNQLLQEMKDNQLEVENQVLEAVENAAQREIDKLQDVKDAFSDTIEDYIGGLQDALDKEQQLYNNSQSEADLNTKRRQLDILRRSGGSAAEIASLEEEINNSERDLYFEYQQQEIDAIQDAADRQLEAMETQIDLMTEQLEYQKLHGLLWEQVASIMNKSPAEIASYIQTNNENYWGKSALDMQESMKDVLFKADQWVAFRKDTGDIKTLISGLFADQNKAAFDEFNKSMKQQFGDLWTSDSSAAVRDIFMKTLAETGDITKAIEAVRGTDTYKKVKEAKEKKDNKSKTTTTDQNKKKNTNNDNNTVSRTYYKNMGPQGHQKMLVYKNGKEEKSGGIIGHTLKFDENTHTSKCTAFGCNYELKRKIADVRKPQPGRDGVQYEYARGGMVENTGTALLHAKEGVLTPEQTATLRNEILGNKNTSLMNLLLQFREIAAGNASQADYATIDRGSGSPIVIEKAVVEMNVAKLANSYDARQAGKDALNEMVKIARKTGVQGVGR